MHTCRRIGQALGLKAQPTDLAMRPRTHIARSMQQSGSDPSP